MGIVDNYEVSNSVKIVTACYWAQEPHWIILMTRGGGKGGEGPTVVHILYPKKSQLQNLSTLKKSLCF